LSLRAFTISLLAGVCLTASLAADQAAPAAGPNSDPAYQQLRNLTLGAEAFTVNNLELKRDAATFHLHSGTVCFVKPVQGKVTGAVFVGDGNLILDPPIRSEDQTLKLLTREDEFSEKFAQLVLRFTDSTYEEIKKTSAPAPVSCDAGLLQESQNALRHQLRYNLDARILQDVLGSDPGKLFVAFIKGKHYSSKMVLAIDPHGAPELAQFTFGEEILAVPLAPEEVELMTYEDNKNGYWASFHLSDEYKTGVATGSQMNGVIKIEHQQLDTTIEKNAYLRGSAATTFSSQVSGLRVVPFNLFRTLRVQNVKDKDGQPLAFVQEDRHEDSQYWVVLNKPLAAGESYTVTTTYEGKDAVRNEGGGNYFPIAREDWYPSGVGAAFGQFATYDMKFSIPKGMKIAATGTMISEENSGGNDVSVWKSEGPQTIAGFNFGRFKMQEAKLDKPEYLVQSYANENPPDNVQALLNTVHHDLPNQFEHGDSAALGSMSTVPLIKKALAEGELSIGLYTDYFGPVPFKRLAMTQQTACSFGQSWPALVWLPMCAFYDTTIRNQLGFTENRGYWKIVAPHEVAHQWWGHDVGFSSYRDQWMSEGFAEMSASLFLQYVEHNPGKFIDFWNEERELLLERDKEGFRAIDAGPLTLGYRLSNTRSGFETTRRLIYPKGAYVLHMIRMMMWDNRTGDQRFKAMMHDFVKTYAGRSATTEDFKATVEKYMSPLMDIDGNHKMDWFFNEYVYGTALPAYKFESSVGKDPNGDALLSIKLSQQNVDQNFKLLVPLYMEMADGRHTELGRVQMVGTQTVEQKIPIKGMKETPQRLLINYNDDVLASPN